jgi:hypothetical protein
VSAPALSKEPSFGRCSQERVPQPVGFRSSRNANCFGDLPRLFRRQSHREDDGDTFLRQPGAAHFGFHTNSYLRIRKCWTSLWFFVYKSRVPNNGTLSCKKSARASLARLADQRLTASTVAGDERLAMNTAVEQGSSPRAFARSLKIEESGNLFRGKRIPKIRICGQWLERAGFKPGHRVELVVEQPGTLTLRFVEQRDGGAQ